MVRFRLSSSILYIMYRVCSITRYLCITSSESNRQINLMILLLFSEPSLLFSIGFSDSSSLLQIGGLFNSIARLRAYPAPFGMSLLLDCTRSRDGITLVVVVVVVVVDFIFVFVIVDDSACSDLSDVSISRRIFRLSSLEASS